MLMGSEGGSGRVLPALLSPPFKVPKVPKLLLPAYQLQFSSDSSRLFVAAARGSVHVLQLLEPGGCKHLHTFQPPSGSGWWGARGVQRGPWASSPVPAVGVQRGVQGQACVPFLALGCVGPSLHQPLCLCCPHVLARAGERGTQVVGGGHAGPDVSWGRGWGSSCLTSLSTCYSW